MNCKYIFTAALATMALSSGCDEAIVLKEEADESGFRTDLSGMLTEAGTNRSEVILELYEDNTSAEAVFRLSAVPAMGVDASIRYDADFLDTYNDLHGTSFDLYPESLVTLPETEMTLAPDEKISRTLEVNLKADDSIEADKTYVLPLKAESRTEGVTVPEKSAHLVYLVKDMRSRGFAYKGDGAVQNVMYMEVNSANPLNLLELRLKGTGKLFYDQLVIFSANINMNAEKVPYVYCNPNVQALLDNNGTLLQPLRRQGIKVILCILGNHDTAGVAQLSQLGATTFARELADYVYAYNLDGVAFDDEWSLGPGSSPFLSSHNSESAARLCYESKMAMPDKIVTFYVQGSMSTDMPSHNGYEPGSFVDYIVGDYGQTPKPLLGSTKRNASGYSVALARSTGELETTARRVKEDGYGYFMTYDLMPQQYNLSLTQLNDISLGLYDRGLETPKYWYRKTGEGKYDTERVPLEL